MAPRACFLILSFAAALRGTHATDDSVCMLQNSATASGELTEAAAAQVSEEKPWNPFWWVSTKAKGKELMAKPQWPFKDMKAKPSAEEAKKMKEDKDDKDNNEEAEADHIVVVQDTPAVTATAPPKAAKAVAPQATPTAPAPETPFVSASPFKVPTEPAAPAVSEEEPEASAVPRSVAATPTKSPRWHLERKYAADYPGGPTLAVRQRLQKARLAAEQERKEELKKKWHQRQAKERRMAELKQKEKQSALLHEQNTRELELQKMEAALQRRQGRKEEVAKLAREQEKAEKKRSNEKRKREYAARMEQQHWENEAKERRAARAAKGHVEKEVLSKHAQVQLSMEQEKQHESQREEALTRKYGHEVKPALQHGTVNLKVWSPFQAHSIDAKVPLTARMDVLMKVAATRLGVAPETAHLKWGHRVLSGQVTVGTYGLKDGDELHLEQVQGH